MFRRFSPINFPWGSCCHFFFLRKIPLKRKKNPFRPKLRRNHVKRNLCSHYYFTMRWVQSQPFSGTYLCIYPDLHTIYIFLSTRWSSPSWRSSITGHLKPPRHSFRPINIRHCPHCSINIHKYHLSFHSVLLYTIKLPILIDPFPSGYFIISLFSRETFSHFFLPLPKWVTSRIRSPKTERSAAAASSIRRVIDGIF